MAFSGVFEMGNPGMGAVLEFGTCGIKTHNVGVGAGVRHQGMQVWISPRHGCSIGQPILG